MNEWMAYAIDFVELGLHLVMLIMTGKLVEDCSTPSPAIVEWRGFRIQILTNILCRASDPTSKEELLHSLCIILSRRSYLDPVGNPPFRAEPSWWRWCPYERQGTTPLLSSHSLWERCLIGTKTESLRRELKCPWKIISYYYSDVQYMTSQSLISWTVRSPSIEMHWGNY